MHTRNRSASTTQLPSPTALRAATQRLRFRPGTPHLPRLPALHTNTALSRHTPACTLQHTHTARPTAILSTRKSESRHQPGPSPRAPPPTQPLHPPRQALFAARQLKPCPVFRRRGARNPAGQPVFSA
eukprot:2975432-Rhodomonas_salina.3